jgi:hypothetical protein
MRVVQWSLRILEFTVCDNSVILSSCFLHVCICAYTPSIELNILVPGCPADTKTHRCSSPFYKRVWYLRVTYIHPPVYFKLSLDYLEYLIECKCYVNSYLGLVTRKMLYLFSMDTIFSKYF